MRLITAGVLLFVTLLTACGQRTPVNPTQAPLVAAAPAKATSAAADRYAALRPYVGLYCSRRNIGPYSQANEDHWVPEAGGSVGVVHDTTVSGTWRNYADVREVTPDSNNPSAFTFTSDTGVKMTAVAGPDPKTIVVQFTTNYGEQSYPYQCGRTSQKW